jgi:hypothetical protein
MLWTTLFIEGFETTAAKLAMICADCSNCEVGFFAL